MVISRRRSKYLLVLMLKLSLMYFSRMHALFYQGKMRAFNLIETICLAGGKRNCHRKDGCKYLTRVPLPYIRDLGLCSIKDKGNQNIDTYENFHLSKGNWKILEFFLLSTAAFMKNQIFWE